MKELTMVMTEDLSKINLGLLKAGAVTMESLIAAKGGGGFLPCFPKSDLIREPADHLTAQKICCDA